MTPTLGARYISYKYIANIFHTRTPTFLLCTLKCEILLKNGAYCFSLQLCYVPFFCNISAYRLNVKLIFNALHKLLTNFCHCTLSPSRSLSRGYTALRCCVSKFIKNSSMIWERWRKNSCNCCHVMCHRKFVSLNWTHGMQKIYISIKGNIKAVVD